MTLLSHKPLTQIREELTNEKFTVTIETYRRVDSTVLKLPQNDSVVFNFYVDEINKSTIKGLLKKLNLPVTDVKTTEDSNQFIVTTTDYIRGKYKGIDYVTNSTDLDKLLSQVNHGNVVITETSTKIILDMLENTLTFNIPEVLTHEGVEEVLKTVIDNMNHMEITLEGYKNETIYFNFNIYRKFTEPWINYASGLRGSVITVTTNTDSSTLINTEIVEFILPEDGSYFTTSVESLIWLIKRHKLPITLDFNGKQTYIKGSTFSVDSDRLLNKNEFLIKLMKKESL